MTQVMPLGLLRHLALLACIFTAGFPGKTQGQAIGYDLHRLEISDLLPEGTSRDIHLDRKGSLWFSVGKKSYRYDGYTLFEVPIERVFDRNARHLGVGRFVEDRFGGIWLLDVESKLYKYRPTSKQFSHVSFSNVQSLAEASIDLVHSGEDGGLWLSITGTGLVQLDPSTEQIINQIETDLYLPADDFITDITSQDTLRVLAISSGGILLDCGAYSKSCTSLDIRRMAGNPDGFSLKELLPTSGNTLTLTTFEHGLFLLSLDSLSLQKIEPLRHDQGSGSTPFTIWEIHTSTAGELWIATPEGLYVQLSRGEPPQLASFAPGQPSTAILDFEDLGNGTTLAQSATDIYLLRSSRFEAYYSSVDNLDAMITSFSQDTDGLIYVGSLGGLAALQRPLTKGALRQVPPPQELEGDPRLMALHADENGSLWIGGISGGLREYRKGQTATERASNDSEIDDISVIRELDSETLLVGSPESGVALVSKSDHAAWRAAHADKTRDPQGNAVFSLIKTADNQVVIGGDRGITYFSLIQSESGPELKETASYLAGEVVFDVYEASTGDIWVGTHQAGLFRSAALDQKGRERFLPVDTSPSLPDKTIYAIEEDSLGLLWLATNRGLVRLNPETYTITAYSESDGITDDEFNLGASLRDKEGYLYFGGNKGLVRFDPRKFVEQRVPPPLNITEIMIHREPVPYDPAYVDIPELVLTHNDHSLDVEFSAMDIINPGRSRYKYRLENFDSDWVDVGTRNTATFTSLPSGEYMLRVIGADSKGVWNYDGIVLPVRVLPAPWLTWWAFTFYVLLIISLVTLLKRFYDTHLEKIAATREAEDMKLTATLAMDDLQHQLEVENRLVDNLRKHASNAFDMVEEILTLELEELYADEIEEPLGRARQRLHCLKALESSVYFHGDLLKVNFRDAVDRSFAEVIKAHPHPAAELVLANDCSEELVTVELAAPLLILAHELLLNSTMHAFPDSVGVECIEVGFRREAGTWIFELSDSGCGLPEAIDPSCPTTMGMELVARIAKRLSATIKVEREAGTRYRIEIPDGFG